MILIVFRLASFRVFVVIPALLYRFIHCPPIYLLSFLPSSQLGHIVQLALRDLPLLFLRSSFSFSLIGLLLPLSTFLPLSQLGHIVQLALGIFFLHCSFSLSFIFCCIILFRLSRLSPPLLLCSYPSLCFLCPLGVQLVAYCSAHSIFLFSLLLFSPLDPPGHIVRFVLRVSSSPFPPSLLPLLLSLLPSSSSPRSQPGHFVRLAASPLSFFRFSSLPTPLLSHSPVSLLSQ